MNSKFSDMRYLKFRMNLLGIQGQNVQFETRAHKISVATFVTQKINDLDFTRHIFKSDAIHLMTYYFSTNFSCGSLLIEL